MSRISKIFRRRIAYPLLKRFSPEQTAGVDGFRVCVSLRDEIIGRFLWHEGQYEAEILSLINRMDLEGKVCVDVGANIGLHTLVMSARAREVYAFEPEPYNFSLLEKNIKINRRENVKAFRCALGESAGELHLALNPYNYGDHRISDEGMPVKVETADRLLSELPDNSIGLVKIDVQGYECHVLRGMRETFSRNPNTLLLLEIFPEGLRQAGNTPTELISMLKEIGFDGYEVHSHRLIPLLESSAYETIIDGKDVNVLLGRDASRVLKLIAPA